MTRFRRSLAAILADDTNYVMLRGDPPAAVVQHRSFMIDLFSNSGTNRALKQHLLQNLPNGNWARQDKIELYLPAGVEVDEAKYRQEVVAALLMCVEAEDFAYIRNIDGREQM